MWRQKVIRILLAWWCGVLFFVWFGASFAGPACFESFRKIRLLSTDVQRCEEIVLLFEKNGLEQCGVAQLQEAVEWCRNVKKYDVSLNLQTLACKKLKKRQKVRCENKSKELRKRFTEKIAISFKTKSSLFPTTDKNIEGERPRGMRQKTLVFEADKPRHARQQYCELLYGTRLGVRSRSPKKKLSETKEDCEVSKPMQIRILFATASAKIRPLSRPLLESLVEVLRERFPEGSGVLLISGHTDIRGSKKHNKKLSIRRAEAVCRALKILLRDRFGNAVVKKGWAYTEGLASKYPIASNATPRGRALNRRVEFLWISKK